jgi:hypothetical protein
LSRFTPTNILSAYDAIAALNNNFTEIASLLDEMLSRTGDGTNSMQVDLDMNHFKVQNLADGVSNSDAVNLGQVNSLITALNPVQSGELSGLPVFDIRDYGAKCDGAATDWTNVATITGTDDVTAVNAAIAAAEAAGGGIVYIPAHTLCSGQINLDNKYNIRLVGAAGSGIGYHTPPPSQLIYTGGGSSPFINGASSYAVTVSNLGVRNSSSSFTGDLIAFTNLAAPSTPDPAYALVERCLVGGLGGIHSARSCISLEGAILSSVVDNNLGWAQACIRGQKERGVGNILYSNGIVVTRNTFQNVTIGAIINPSQGWHIAGNWFEGTNDGFTGGMPKAIYCDFSSASVALGAAINVGMFTGNWLGDATNVSVAWIDPNLAPMTGVIMGNQFSNVVTYPSIRISGGSTSGLLISGNSLSFVDFCSKTCRAVTLTNNFWYSDPANITSDTTDLWIFSNKKDQNNSAPTIIRIGDPQDLQFGGDGINSIVYGNLNNLKSIGFTTTYTVATLPSTGFGKAMVSDSTVVAAGNFGAAVVGGGSNIVPVYRDGTTWRIG